MRHLISIARSLLGRVRAARAGGPRARRLPARWLRRPGAMAGERVCVFVMLARDGRLLPHAVDHARAWAEAGFRVVAVVVVDSFDSAVDAAPLGFADGLLLRVNRGYDFAAWAAAIVGLGRAVRGYAVLATVNDSVVGPSAGFGAMIDRAERSDADLIGLVESYEIRRHLQSFALLFKPGALRSRAFRRFWRGVRTGDREYVIAQYELSLRDRFAAAGLKVEALYPADADAPRNPTLCDWRTLLEAGFPYLKVQLLRQDPRETSLTDWRDLAARHGFDLPRLDRQLAELEAAGGAPWAYRTGTSG